MPRFVHDLVWLLHTLVLRPQACFLSKNSLVLSQARWLSGGTRSPLCTAPKTLKFSSLSQV